jgi:hypothetical protein
MKGQTQISNDELSKETHKIGNSMNYYIEYSIEENSNDKLTSPRDKDQNIAEITDSKLNSIEKLNQITKQIFTTEQAEYLAKHNCYFSCILTSSGKIINSSMIFYNSDPKVNRKQLLEFLFQITANLSFDLSFDREVVQIGYITLTHPAFPSLMKDEFVRTKH